MDKSYNDFKIIAILLIEQLEKKIKKEISDISNWANTMAVAAGELHNVNMTKADKLYRNQFFKASHNTEYKQLYSQREITNFLNKFTALGKFKKFLEKTAKLLTALEVTLKVVEGLKTSIKLFKIGTQIGLPSQTRTFNNKTPEDIEKEIEEGVKKFTALMEALRALNALSPPGFREYFEYGMAILRESNRLVTITKEYTKHLGKTMKLSYFPTANC